MKEFQGRHIHFVGIGGYGMSGLAQVLHQTGHRVSGCDVSSNPRTRRLLSMGIGVQQGHSAAHLESVSILVYSTDIPADNPEMIEARARGITIMHRSEVLALFLNRGHGIAISGTHGKTTTTALSGMALLKAGYDPTVFVGGEVAQLGGTARPGLGPWVIAEACESDGTLAKYAPLHAIVTSIEPEHLDHHDGDLDMLVEAFRQFLGQILPRGSAILCADDSRLREMAGKLPGATRLYGLDPSAHVRVVNPEMRPGSTTWEITVDGRSMGRFSSSLPGLHNAVNATAVASLLLELGSDLEPLREVLGSYRGVDRRFQFLAQGPISVVSDYAHHPTEIRATIRSARQYGPARVLAVFQPQRFSRTRDLWEEFSGAFSEADLAVLTEIYSPAGEKPLEGISGQNLAGDVALNREGPTVFQPNLDSLVDYLSGEVREGDMVLVMGAGDIWKAARDLALLLESKTSDQKAHGFEG